MKVAPEGWDASWAFKGNGVRGLVKGKGVLKC